MYMPGRNFEDTNTHVMNISVMKMVPQHYPVNVSLAGAPPTGWNYMATATGSTGTTPPRLIVQTTYNMDGVSYILPFYSPGISQTFSIIVINVSSAVYLMGIKQGGSYMGPTQYVYGPGYYSFNFTPSATAGFVTFELWDVTSPPPGTTVFLGPQIELEPITLDSIVLTPMNVVSQIASDDQYHYGFNGKYKDNEFAGVGNHLDFGARGYDTRVCRFTSLDPARLATPWKSPYDFAENSPIKYVDYNGEYKLDPYFQKQYPMLTNLLVHYAPQLQYNPQIRKKFMDATGYSENQFDQMVKWNSGPWVTPTRQFTGTHGPQYGDENQFSPLYPDNIFINSERFEELEQKLKELKKRGGGDAWELEEEMFVVMVVILHESGHRAYYQTTGGLGKDVNRGGEDRGFITTKLMFGDKFSTISRTTGLENYDEEARQRARDYAKKYFGQSFLYGLTLSPYYNGGNNGMGNNHGSVGGRDPSFGGGNAPEDDFEGSGGSYDDYNK